MASQIYVNLPVKDLDRSVAFFTKLGYTFNPQFTNANATCMIVGENIFVMLLVEKFFKTFTPNAICDATKSTEVIVCLSAESREKIDETVRTAVAAGGRIYTRGARPRLHVWSWIPGSGRPHLGAGLHASGRDAVIAPRQFERRDN
jgi:predicted lactoylglutathione lyase